MIENPPGIDFWIDMVVRHFEQARRQHLLGVKKEVAAFCADRDAHPCFDKVRRIMAELMERGAANNLQDAYDMAVAKQDAEE
jgi:hypothetical protein